MKKIAILTIAAAACVAVGSAYGQGSIDLNTFDANANAGAGMKVQTGVSTFINAPAGTQIEIFGGASAGSLAPLVSQSSANFNVSIYTLTAADVNANGNGSGVDYGYAAVSGVSAAGPGNVPPGGTGFFMIEAWLAGTGGNSFATAQYTYQSAVFTSTVGAAIIPPGAPVTGALNFTGQILLTPAPEPTTIALGGLGAAALLLFRRRK